MHRPTTPPHQATLVVLVALSTLSLNMFLPSLASIATDLEASYALVGLAVSGYLAITAGLQLALGPLSDRIGRRPIVLGALAVFVAASLVCASATNIWVFLGARMLQAVVVAGAGLALAIIRDTSAERDAASRIGYLASVMALAPMLGPVLGGVLDTAFGWRASFWLYAIAGIAVLSLVWIDLGETRRAASRPEPAWSLLAEPRFWAYAACGALSTGSFYVFIAGAPLVAARSFGVGTAELGIYVGSITGGYLVGSFAAGKLARTQAPHAMMLAGRIVASAGAAAGLALVLAGATSPFAVFACTIFVGMGNGITKPSSHAAALSVRPRLAGSAAGLNGALDLAGGAALTAITVAVLPADDPAAAMLALMLAVCLGGMAAVLWAIRLERVAPAGQT